METAVEKPEREAVLQENYGLTRKLGYVGFRERFFNDPEVITEWPDPAVREREVRRLWNTTPAGGFAAYAEQYVDDSIETLSAFRDYLRGLSASGVHAQVAFYEEASERGRRERLLTAGDRSGEVGDISPAYETLVMRLPGDFDSPLSREELKSLAEEIRQDEHAARVRDYGEADAATYDARMDEAYRYRAEALGLAGSPERPSITDAELERFVGKLEQGWVEGHGTMDNPMAREELIGERAASEVPRRRQHLNWVGEGERRVIAAYNDEVDETTRAGSGKESGLALAWQQAASDRKRLEILADLAADHGVEQEVFVRTAHRVFDWSEATTEQRAWMAALWTRAMDLDHAPLPTAEVEIVDIPVPLRRDPSPAGIVEQHNEPDTAHELDKRIAVFKREGVSTYAAWGKTQPWSDLTAEQKLYEIYRQQFLPSFEKSGITADETLTAIEREVDFDGLLPIQQDMLRLLRTKIDGAVFSGDTSALKLAKLDLGDIVSIGDFEEGLTAEKEAPIRTWSSIPEAEKLDKILLLAKDTGAPGIYTLGSIECEIDYKGLARMAPG
jgi:hypothetical protein